MAGDPVALTRTEKVAGHRYITRTKHRRFLSPHVTTKRKKSYVKKRERVGEV